VDTGLGPAGVIFCASMPAALKKYAGYRDGQLQWAAKKITLFQMFP